MVAYQGPHIGTLSHFVLDGATVDERPLETFIDLAPVIDLRATRSDPTAAKLRLMWLPSDTQEIESSSPQSISTCDSTIPHSSTRWLYELNPPQSGSSTWGLSIVTNDFMAERIDTRSDQFAPRCWVRVSRFSNTSGTRTRPCLDAVQIVCYGPSPKNEIGERRTHGPILFPQSSY